MDRPEQSTCKYIILIERSYSHDRLESYLPTVHRSVLVASFLLLAIRHTRSAIAEEG